MGRLGVLAVMVVVFLVLPFGRQLVEFYTDWLWFQEVGYAPVFLRVLALRGGLFLTVSLVNAKGERLASTQVQSDAFGGFSGSLVAPAGTQGKVMLVAESTYEDATILTGPSDWYGKSEIELSFPTTRR